MKLQDVRQVISEKVFPKRHALERELSVLRAEHAQTMAELGGVRDELLQTRAQDDQQLADLKQQLSELNAERRAAEAQARELASSLAEATARQQGAEQQIESLEQRLIESRDRYERSMAAERKAAEAQLRQLESSLAEATARQQDAGQQIESLEQRLTETRDEYERSLTAERTTAEAQLRKLEFTLAEANSRRQGAEEQTESLQQRLTETRSQYERSVGLTQETLHSLQSEQENLHSQQSVLAKSFHEVGRQLLESVQRHTRPVRSRLQTTLLAALLFVSGALLGGLVVRQEVSSVDLSPIRDGMVELQRLMQAHFESNSELLKMLTDRLDRETTGLDQTPAAGQQQEPQSMATPGRLLERQRRDLALLGFEPQGDGIDAALAQFRALYLPVARGKPAPSADEVDTVLGEYAELARKDIDRYKLDAGVLAAIRLASRRTGVEFSFLMELAATESSFNPKARASTSSAVGLYQFKDDTWLDSIKNYGHKYGLNAIRKRIVYVIDSDGMRQPTIEDPQQLARALDLRLQPRLSALLAAEHVRRNTRQLSTSLDRKPERTDLYLTHFFGASGAISFLKVLAENPQRIARELFPGPARRNRSIFQTKADKPRTVAEIYRLFARKFNTDRFRDGEPG